MKLNHKIYFSNISPIHNHLATGKEIITKLPFLNGFQILPPFVKGARGFFSLNFKAYSLIPNKAFTLVELIVVITILAILGTIGFVSYTGFMSTARDSNRLTQLEGIHNGLETYKTKGKLPIPDDSVTIYASGTIIGYQGNGGETVLNKIGYQKGGKDPLEDKYYTYYTDKKQQNIELLGFLENDPGASKETTFNRTEKGELRTEYGKKQETVIVLSPFVNGHQTLPPFVKGG